MSAYNTLMNLTGGFSKQAADDGILPAGMNEAVNAARQNIDNRRKAQEDAAEKARLSAEAQRQRTQDRLRRRQELEAQEAQERNNDYTQHNVDVVKDIIGAYGSLPLSDVNDNTLNELPWTAARLQQIGQWAPEQNEALAKAMGDTGFWSDWSGNKEHLTQNATAFNKAVRHLYDADADLRNGVLDNKGMDVSRGVNLFNKGLAAAGGLVPLANDPLYADLAPFYAGKSTELQTREPEIGADTNSLDADNHSDYTPSLNNILNVPQGDASQDPNVQMPKIEDGAEQHVPNIPDPQMPQIPYMPKMDVLPNMQDIDYSAADLDAAGFKAPDISTWQHLKNMGRDYGGKLLNWLKGKHTNMMGSGVDVPNWALALGALGVGGLGAYGINQYMKSREEEEYYERMRRLMAQQALMKSGAARAMSAVDKTEGPTLPQRPTLNERSSLARLMEITRTRGLQNVDFGQKGMNSVKSAAASVMKAKDPDEKGNMEQRPTLRPESSLQKLLRITQTHTSK